MPDNINISVNETTENVVINPSISTDVIDFNLYEIYFKYSPNYNNDNYKNK